VADPRLTDPALRVALAQINPTVGDLQGNADRIRRSMRSARRRGAGILAFPELALTGYPPEDLLLKPRFIEDSLTTLHKLLPETRGLVAIIGFPSRGPDGRLYNAAAIAAEGRIVDIYNKIHLPNYGVFDEARYFAPGDHCPLFEWGGVRFGVSICEDIWFMEGPAKILSEAGAELVININASPYSIGKLRKRREHLKKLTQHICCPVAYLNTVGGQDELVFDGGSMMVDCRGRVRMQAPQFVEGLYLFDLDADSVRRHRCRKAPWKSDDNWFKPVQIGKAKLTSRKRAALPATLTTEMGETEEVYSALVFGTRDYVEKNGFRDVLVALSGGVDSALVASIAVDALGPKRVHGIFLPSRYTSGDSRADAFRLSRNLGIDLRDVSIADIFDRFLETLAPHLRGLKPDVTEENLQARIRGTLVMAFSNKFNWLVLTTGNKSEMSVGYATLYGDMAGGFAVIKDVPKTLVYRLCRWRNRRHKRPWIPPRILSKAPTAELRPDQKDTDSLPPYSILDPVLRAYVEEEQSLDQIMCSGLEPSEVARVVRLVDLAEYKRRQAPPGIKITSRAFGRDRRYPITNRFRNYAAVPRCPKS